MTTDYDNILNEIEKNELAKFADNQTMMGAVKKVLLRGVYVDGTLRKGETPEPLKNFLLSIVSKAMDTDDDKKIANALRAASMGIQVVEYTFEELKKFKKVEALKGELKNPGR